MLTILAILATAILPTGSDVTWDQAEVLWHSNSNAECVVVMEGDPDKWGTFNIDPPCRLDWYLNAPDDEEWPLPHPIQRVLFAAECADMGGVPTDLRGYTFKCESLDY